MRVFQRTHIWKIHSSWGTTQSFSIRNSHKLSIENIIQPRYLMNEFFRSWVSRSLRIPDIADDPESMKIAHYHGSYSSWESFIMKKQARFMRKTTGKNVENGIKSIIGNPWQKPWRWFYRASASLPISSILSIYLRMRISLMNDLC